MIRVAQQGICFDVGFGDNDLLKTNTILEMMSDGIEFEWCKQKETPCCDERNRLPTT